MNRTRWTEVEPLMTMYNMLFGVNPAAPLLLKLLDLTPDAIPRFRDTYLAEKVDEIVVYTRTGGGNRHCPCEEDERAEAEYVEGKREHKDGDGERHYASCLPFMNWKLAQHPNYVRDEDDDFDSTYAEFFFSVPEPAQEVITMLREAGGDTEPPPRQKWDKMLTKLREGDKSDPFVQQALEVGQQVFSAIQKKLDEGGGTVEI